MDVVIRQPGFFALGYTIETPTISLLARRKSFSLQPRIEISPADGEVSATVTRKLSLSLSPQYTLRMKDGRVFQYSCENSFKGIYVCQGDTDSYHLYMHKGFHTSIFQGATQIAAVRMEPNPGDEDFYDIRINPSADLLIIACMLLAFSVDDNNNEQSAGLFGQGRIGPEARPFDTTWRPIDETPT